MDCLAIHATNTRWVSGGTEYSVCGMEDRDARNTRDHPTDGRNGWERGFLGVFLVKKEFANEILEVLLIDVFAEHMECCGILGGYYELG